MKSVFTGECVEVVFQSSGVVDCWAGNLGDSVYDEQGRAYGVITHISSDGLVTITIDNDYVTERFAEES